MPNTESGPAHRALVTGAAGALGSAFIRRLVAEGCEVVATDVSIDALDAALGDCPDGVVRVAADLTSAEDRQQLFATVDDTLGGLDAVVNAAGMISTDGSLGFDPAVWTRILDVNVTATVAVCSLALDRLRSNGREQTPKGFVVNLGSGAATVAAPRQAAYAASKAAVASYTRSIAGAVADDGICAVLLIPGRVEAGMAGVVADAEAAARDVDIEQVRAERQAASPLGRFQPADEVAQILSWVLGQHDLRLNGQAVWCDARSAPIT